MARAEEVDAYLKREGKVIGPLHGLPVSLKDQFNMKGLETIMGQLHVLGVCAAYSTDTARYRICIVGRKRLR